MPLSKTGSPPWARRAGLAVLGLFLLLLGAGALLLRPPDPRPVSAPAEEFSAQRALKDAEAIGGQPRPLGSAASRAAREHLTRRLTELGGTVRAGTEPVSTDGQGTALVARVTNIHATFPGSGGADAGHVLLMAHYDSVPAGPGASDNAVNVAAVLEVVRALRFGGDTPRNTVDVLFTDGEEPGLLGARAFAARDTLDPANTVVVNLEARGVSGPSIMFESGPRNSGALSALADADRPIATSLADEIYSFLPNDTDFSVFKDKGFGGLNFAFVDGSAHYHTPNDSLRNVSAGSLQHQGDSVLAVTRHLTGKDLSALPDGRQDTYFTVLGLLVHYPQALAPAVALTAAAAYGLTLRYARRRGVALGGAGRAALTLPAALAAAAAIGFGGWQALCALRPGYADLPMGDSYRPHWYRAAFLVLTVAAVTGWRLLLRRRVDAVQLALGVWGWFTGLALVTAFLTPGASYLFAWAPLLGCAGLVAALRACGDRAWWTLGTTAASVTALVLLLPVIVLVFPTLGLALAAAPLVVTALLAAASLPLLEVLPRRTVPASGLLGLAAGLALLLTGVRIDTFDTRHPQHTSLAYAWDADRGSGLWLSADGAPPQWTARLAGNKRSDLRAAFPTFPTTLADGLAGRSPLATVASGGGPAAPDVTVTSTGTAGGERTVRLRIEPAGGTAYLSVFADTSKHTVRGARTLGADVPGGVNRPSAAGPWKWGMVVWTVPEEGLDIEVRVAGRGELPLRVTAYTRGLPQGPGRLPAGLTWSTWGANLTDVTAVGMTVRG